MHETLQDGTIVLTPPFSPVFKQYAHTIRLEAIEDVHDQAVAVFEEAARLLQPKAMVRLAWVEAFEQSEHVSSVGIAGRMFAGKALSVLDHVHRVFPYIATCGNGMESFDTSSLDWMAPYWIDAIKMQALGTARRALVSFLQETYGIGKPLSVNPGSGNVDIWPITEQPKLFDLLAQGRPVGVELTESFLMIPNKTISGFFFSKPGTDYQSCAHCERANCPDRRTAFTLVL